MALPSAKIIELDETNTCKLCDNALAKYSCPKCDILYCSLSCYRSERHLQCSEQFYMDCVTEELAQGGPGADSQARMLEILKRYNLDSVDEERDSDDDEDVDDLADRLAGVDLDNADLVWDKLTDDERQDFISFLKTDDVTKLIPSWHPWWVDSCEKVQPVDSATSYKTKAPKLLPVKDFARISKKEPQDCVRHNLVNVIAAYAFTARYFNGEHCDFVREAVTCVISVSLALKDNHNFDSWDAAVKSVEMQCTQSDWILADLENYQLLRDDVTGILRGPCDTDRTYYTLAALSDLYDLMEESLKTKRHEKKRFTKLFPDDHFPDVKVESRNKIKNAMKKIVYLLSFAKDKL